jgi:hypothetical protein
MSAVDFRKRWNMHANDGRNIGNVRRWQAARLPLSVALAAATVVACGARTNLYTDETGQFGTSSTFGEKITCQGAGVEVTLQRQESTVMVLLDRSASMLQPMEGSLEGRSRWSVLTDAMARVVPNVNQDAKLGLSMFPAADACEVASAFEKPLPLLAPGRSTEIMSLVHGAYPAGGKTPTFAALQLARDALIKVDPKLGARSVVLITDGVPNCGGNYDPSTCECVEPADDGTCPSTLDCLDAARPLEFIRRLYSEYGIPTYVIGLSAKGDSPYYRLLEGMALAGGRARASRPFFFPGNSEEALEDVLAGAFRDTTACLFQLPEPFAEGTSIEVRVAGALIEAKAKGPVGWTWANEKMGQIMLHESTCISARNKTVTASTVCP